jgi:cation transport ATPase
MMHRTLNWWILAIAFDDLTLTLIVFVLAMGSHLHSFISPHIQPWIELVLATPVVLWQASRLLSAVGPRIKLVT